MSKTDKVAVTIEHEVLRDAERLRRHTGESRSALVTRALRLLVSQETRADKISVYVQGYESVPETRQETELAARLASNVLRDLDW